MSEQPFFILAGGYDTKNVGDYAMLLPLREILSKQGCALKLLSVINSNTLRSATELQKSLEISNTKPVCKAKEDSLEA